MFSFHPHRQLLCVSSLWGVAKIEMLLETGVTSLFLEFCLNLRSSYFRPAVISVVKSTRRFPGMVVAGPHQCAKGSDRSQPVKWRLCQVLAYPTT